MTVKHVRRRAPRGADYRRFTVSLLIEGQGEQVAEDDGYEGMRVFLRRQIQRMKKAGWMCKTHTHCRHPYSTKIVWSKHVVMDGEQTTRVAVMRVNEV